MAAYTCLWVALALVLLQSAQGAVLEYPGEFVEGFNPCQSGGDSAYGSSYQVVATKPSAESDFIPATDSGQSCQMPVQRCGDISMVEQQCKAYPGCAAFNYDGQCGYLKTAGSPTTQRPGWTLYVVA